jgi:hypothetical protein
MRNFETGATRDTDESKFDYEGFLSPLVLERFAAYMHSHRLQADGKLRASDNWQKGIPLDAYMKSGFRHFFDWWKLHRGLSTPYDDENEALCALMFNVMGYLHERLKQRMEQDVPTAAYPISARYPGDTEHRSLTKCSCDFNEVCAKCY